MHKVTKKDWGAPTKQKKKHKVVFRIFLKYRNFAAEFKIYRNGIYRKNYRYTPTQGRSF